jgi:hypothetical protein
MGSDKGTFDSGFACVGISRVAVAETNVLLVALRVWGHLYRESLALVALQHRLVQSVAVGWCSSVSLPAAVVVCTAC